MELGEEDAITWKSLGKYSIRDMADLFRDIAVDNVCCHSETEGCHHNVFCQACYYIYIRSVALHSESELQIRLEQNKGPSLEICLRVLCRSVIARRGVFF
jgi:hypothetical protein